MRRWLPATCSLSRKCVADRHSCSGTRRGNGRCNYRLDMCSYTWRQRRSRSCCSIRRRCLSRSPPLHSRRRTHSSRPCAFRSSSCRSNRCRSEQHTRRGNTYRRKSLPQDNCTETNTRPAWHRPPRRLRSRSYLRRRNFHHRPNLRPHRKYPRSLSYPRRQSCLRPPSCRRLRKCRQSPSCPRCQ
jgi:hypothetical protein